jgi:hypothetical protein
MSRTQRRSRPVSQRLSIDGLTCDSPTGHPHNDATVATDRQPDGSPFALRRNDSLVLLLKSGFCFPAMS